MFERLAPGFDYFAHYAGKSLLVEAAIRHETVARGRAPPAWNFRDVNVEPQAEMGEPMRNLPVELPVRRFNRRLPCRQGRVQMDLPTGSGYFRHAAEEPLGRPGADENRAVPAAHEKDSALAQRPCPPRRLARQAFGAAGMAATKF